MRKLGLLAIVALAGCSHTYMSDDIDVDFDFSPLSGPSDSLHTPYVLGAHTAIYVNHRGDDDMRGWHLVSRRPDVLQIDTVDADEHGTFVAHVTAVGEGTTTLDAYDADGDHADSATIEVLAPDRADLLNHGVVLIDQPDYVAAAGDDVEILAGGTATYLVQYSRAGRTLYGNGALEAPVAGDVFAEPRTTFFFENREWLSITPGAPGESDVGIVVGGQVVRNVHVVSVDESAIFDVSIHGMDERRADSDELMTALAQAWDVDGQPIMGVDYEWQVDGLSQLGLGDIYRYRYTPGATQTLVARRGEIEAAATIHGADGFVDSSNNIGCTAAPGGRPAAGGAIAVSIVGLALFLGRRYRQA